MKRVGCLALSLLFLLFSLLNLAACRKEVDSDSPVPDTTDATATDPASDTIQTTAEELPFDPPTVYRGHEIVNATYRIGSYTYPIRYSDGFFELDGLYYQTHLATASTALSHASVKGPSGDDYSGCSDQVVSVLGQIGFGSVYVSDSYRRKPTVDSIACVFGERAVEVRGVTKRVVSVTVRSGGYEAEWTSNFLLGESGEAKGFADSADKIADLYLGEYLLQNPGLTEALDRGEVIFWLQGYSRGGAVANLLGKRLIDRYQPSGNEVYAYCIEAPYGGVLSCEIKARDYSSIHNVINPYDPVTYLAPTSLGFKRYGIDHYLFSGAADSEHLIVDEAGNPVSDNALYETMTEKRLGLTKKRLVALFDDEGVVASCMPRTVTYKGINLFMKQIVTIKRKTKTPSFIKSFINGITETSDGESVTDRITYVESGMEAAACRLMTYFNTVFDIRYLSFDTAALQEALSEAAEECKDALTDSAYMNDSGKMTANLHGQVARKLVDAVFPRLRNVESLYLTFSDYPDGGVERAFDDLKIVFYRLLYATTDVDDLISFAYSFTDLISNHEYAVNLAILMGYDSWFEPTGTD